MAVTMQCLLVTPWPRLCTAALESVLCSREATLSKPAIAADCSLHRPPESH
jgi:hypothetical protein